MWSISARCPFRLRATSRAVLAASVALVAATAWGGGPRFISGTSGYNKAGIMMAWYTSQPLYFTDPSDLSPSVTHAQADAIVQAAAAAWNVPTANLTLAQGGSLAEHVSSANTFFNGTDFVFPADVQASNYQSIQIAVIYDSDGSVIDLLLGNGASDPSGCLQNGVLESVDQFGSSAVIQHAVILLNGRCVGTDPQQLLQMQYQLTRTFGRVLGLAWSQLNDNIFTGSPAPTKGAEAYWPLMHPIDVYCATYTYQCMQDPFTLRPDDLAALALLYPVKSTTATKTASMSDAVGATGEIVFPTGQGMDLTNVLVWRRVANQESKMEAYPIVSSPTGLQFMQNAGNVVSGVEAEEQNAGANQTTMEGGWSLTRIGAGTRSDDLTIKTENINPLYSGEYAVGPYQRPVIAMSGNPVNYFRGSVSVGDVFNITLTQPGAASKCTSGTDGTVASPAAADPSGWWSGQLCSTGHTSWWLQTVKANRSWTIEVTAVDEADAPTPQKAQPVIGVWNATDAKNMPPTVASQAVALNSMSLGMTQLQIPSAAADATLRIAVADQFGGGRPDFNYNARILYADNVSPTTLNAAGGQITITGIGFRQGNKVMVNGVPATIVSSNATQIVTTAPGKGIAGAGDTPVDVAVIDPSTGGTTVISAALTYNGQAVDTIALVSSPASLETGITATTPFAVKVYQPDGVTPAAGVSVSFTVASNGGGGAVLMNCGTGLGCVATTDVNGLAQQPVMGVSAGSITLTATEMSGGASVQVSLSDTDPVRAVTIAAAPQYLAEGAPGSWALSLTATQDGLPAAGVPAVWSTTAAGFTLTSAAATTAADGTSAIVVQTPAIVGGSTNVVSGCVWNSVCATWTVYGVAASQWMVNVAIGGAQSIGNGTALAPVTLLVTDTAGHALPGATVTVYQTAYAWEGPCPAEGPCPVAPVLASSQSTAVSDSNGLVQVVPQQVAGMAQVLNIAAASGTQGFATTSLAVTP